LGDPLGERTEIGQTGGAMIYLQLQIFADDPLLSTTAVAEVMVNTDDVADAIDRAEACLERKGWRRADVLYHEDFTGRENQAVVVSPLLYGIAKCGGVGMRIARAEAARLLEPSLCAA
jgi:hypothetical protein